MMKRSHLTATTIAVLGMASPSIAGVVPTFASWTDTGNGSLNGVNFTIAQNGGGDLGGGSASTLDLSANSWDNAGAQSGLEYAAGNEFTITFASAVSNLSIYLYS